jgi:Transposase DDE domain
MRAAAISTAGAMVAVTLHGADVGDTTSLVETALAAAEHVEAAPAASREPAALTELIADKGYHSNQTMIDLHAVGVRSYIAEPDRGRRHWTRAPEAQRAVYGNRRRVRGARGKRLLRQRGEYVEWSFAHLYDTGGMRRTHLRGRALLVAEHTFRRFDAPELLPDVAHGVEYVNGVRAVNRRDEKAAA